MAGFAASRALRGFVACAGMLLAPLAGPAQADTPTIQKLYEFSNNGLFPRTGLVAGPGGAYYGTTSGGGSSNYGTVFRLAQDGTLTTLASFPSNNSGGSGPSALLLASDGNFYGTLQSGGSNGSGAVFRISPAGALAILVSFGSSDGTGPSTGVVQGADGNFYGTTAGGGSGGAGTVFRMTPAGVLSTLHSFSGSDGSSPNGLLPGSDGFLYGTTSSGGANNDGTIFRMGSDGSFAQLPFDPSTGIQPSGTLIQASDGNYYGTTYGSALSGSCGTVFRFIPGVGLFALASFPASGSAGCNPAGGVIQGSDGALYGTTRDGGGSNNAGNVFRVAGDGTLSSVFIFDGNNDTGTTSAPLLLGSDGNFYGINYGNPYLSGGIYRLTPGGVFNSLVIFGYPNGANPNAGLVKASDGNLYGTAGNVFRINASGAFTQMATFGNLDQLSPASALIQASDGNFYGTSENGGPGNDGGVFRMQPDGTLSIVFEFNYDNGANPYGGLIQGRDGKLYGTTSGGGASSGGEVYRLGTGGDFSVLGSFNFPSGSPFAGVVQAGDGSFYGVNNSGIFHLATDNSVSEIATFPVGQGANSPLTQGKDGNFYGIVYSGGNAGHGAVYQVTPAGALTTFASFDGSDGAFDPNCFCQMSPLLLASDGNFYGTTYSGGTHNAGTVFKLTPGGSISAVYNFGASSSDGQSPRAGLVQASDGNLYGTTLSGGLHAGGTVYKLSLDGTLSTLHAFDAGAGEGVNPNAALVQGNDGNLYGTTQGGGNKGGGTVFKITVGGTLTTLYAFGSNSTDGAIPSVGLVQASDGNFYGTTEQGGANDKGTIFSVSLAGTLTTLYNFGGSSDGATPRSGLVQLSDGRLCGTTESGGTSGNGTVYCATVTVSANTRTLTENVLHSFGGAPAEGALPRAGLYDGSDGKLYGATQIGGANNLGTVFSLNTDGSAFATLHSFNSADGASPQVALVQGGDGSYYGTTLNGGPHNTGVVFRITPDGTTTTLHTFGGLAPPNGLNPAGDLLRGSDGRLYGTASAGGSNTVGTVFAMGTDGSISTLHTFGSSPSDGANPVAGLVAGGDGNFYGTTLNGGSNGYGTVYSMSPSGSLSTLHSFGNFSGTGQDNDGFNPEGRLVAGSDGNFYGTTLSGGSQFLGTIFRITPGGVLTTLYSFGSAAGDGSAPGAGLVDGKDGNFYGTTYSGGEGGSGTVFKVSPAGGLTTLYSFGVAGASSSDGANPQAALALGSDGKLYGTTRYGGSKSLGTVFQISTGGSYKTLYSFGSASGDGANPQAALVLGGDGKLYGTTSAGGTFGHGTAFSIGTDGTLTALYSFGGSAGDAGGPLAGLTTAAGTTPVPTQGSSQVFYGVTYSGGANGTGAVYRLEVAPGAQGGGGGGGALPPQLLLLLGAGVLMRRLRVRARAPG